MSNNKYIVLPEGKECRPVNPYQKHPTPDSETIYEVWQEFEYSAPTFPLTEVMPEGEAFEGAEVTQICHTAGWSDLMPSEIQLYVNSNATTRIAIKPIKAIEPVKEAVISDIVSNHNSAIDIINKFYAAKPPLDVVENKETVEQAIERIIGEAKELKINVGFGLPGIDVYNKFTNSFTSLSTHHIRKMLNEVAQYKQSQSIEGIVGFVLEWVAKNADVEILENHVAVVDKQGILEMKSDIIKDYNQKSKS